MSFSNSGGGTLALPSPTHAHQMDVTSAVRSLRRSISRSPSKFLARHSSQSSDGSQRASPSPQSQSPCRRVMSTPHLQLQRQQHTPSHIRTAPVPVPERPSTPHQLQSRTLWYPQSQPQCQSQTLSQTPTHSPFRPNVKLSLRSAKSSKTSTPSRPLARSRASPKSPFNRPIRDTTNGTNPTQGASSSPLAHSPGKENTKSNSASPAARKSPDKSSRHSFHLDVSGTSQSSHLKALDANSESYMVSTTGALKRSDATMNLDYPNQGSPVAKRRSLHGISSLGQSEEFSIFGSTATNPQTFDIHEDSNPEYELTSSSTFSAIGTITTPDTPLSPSVSNVPKRSSSLRKSTLQQRYGDKSSFGKRMGERHLAQMNAQMNAEMATPPRLRPRLSTDHFIPPSEARDSYFAFASPLPVTSHPQVDSKPHQPHPLSKTLTTSSSGGSLTEETPLYAPANAVERPKPHPFSRSLPLNASRPTGRPGADLPKAVATPNHTSQLWIGAFNSTGLISKVNRNPEEDNEKRIAPPDTPCKKQSNPFATFPPPAGSAFKRRNNNNRNSFGGIPTTPFNPISGQGADTFGNPGKGLSIFQRGSASRSSRRASILSLEGDEQKLFGDPTEAVTPLEGDVPPTPTKNLTPSLSNLSEQSLESPSANRTIAPPMSAVRPTVSREGTGKSYQPLPQTSQSDAGDLTREGARDPLASSARNTSVSPASLHSFGQSRALRGFQSPAPLGSNPASLSQNSSGHSYTKDGLIDLASPVERRRTPQTPQEGLLPLDTSRLSISHVNENPADNGMPPPVTPTTGRDFRSSTSIFVTPVNARQSTVDIDASLCSKFDKVDQIGHGEFSTVYRVTKTDNPATFSLGSTTPSFSKSTSPSKGAVYAVKKSKQAYLGQRDRDNKLREVRVLESLTHAEHVVHYMDSWEHNFHLYIQTEFCEEGTLDKFLANIGRNGRLDDFRIFKIMLDLSLGLKEIHDAGFMHLDMKPANILITFEGALKIGDFGLAQPCPLVGGVDMEGDREYMAPEVLRGRADRSSDVFSLGLMTLEVAANVVLPDNGPTWVALRSGDLSEVPSLTWVPSSEVQHDDMGDAVDSVDSATLRTGNFYDAGNLFGSFKRSELQQPPDFMMNALNSSSLDSIVRWMTAQEPCDRPVIDQVLDLDGLRWVAENRNAPATIYEGNWGPAAMYPVAVAADDDTEMTDV